jgi:carbamoyltransferase
MLKDKKWEALFVLPTRDPAAEFAQVHCNLGLAIQLITEEVVFEMAK